MAGTTTTTKPKGSAPKMTPEERERAKRERFLKLAEKRTNAALSALRRVGNLSGPGYTYSDAEGEAIVTALIGGVNSTVKALRREKSAKPTFQLPVG